MKSKAGDAGRYMGTARVGPKGQIVIPKEVRDLFGIQPGDTLILLADAQKGIAIERMSFFTKIADAILSGTGRKTDLNTGGDDAAGFAEGIRKIVENEGEKQ